MTGHDDMDHIQRHNLAAVKELYNLALGVTGRDSEARCAVSEALTEISGGKKAPDAERFRQLSIRALYRYGKNHGVFKERENEAAASECGCREAPAGPRAKLLGLLEPLSYNERFVLLLFCCQKLTISQISEILRLPSFIVTRWLYSASRKIASVNQPRPCLP